MNAIDLSSLYRNSIGFDRFASLIDNALTTELAANEFPPYNIEMLDETRYVITLAVAGFSENELDIQLEKGVLTVNGNKQCKQKNEYLYQGIKHGKFERKFSLADYIEITGAELSNGLLTIGLKKEIPEAIKPKSIAINKGDSVLLHNSKGKAA